MGGGEVGWGGNLRLPAKSVYLEGFKSRENTSLPVFVGVLALALAGP